MSTTVTALYFDENSLTLSKQVLRDLPVGDSGRVILPTEFRHGKSIVAILEGDVTVLNAVGERVLPLEADSPITPRCTHS